MRPEDRYDSLLRYYAGQNRVPFALLKAIMLVESSANPRARSPAGAAGLMQFVLTTWRRWGSGDRENPEESIRAGAAYLRHLYDRFAEIPDETERWKVAVAAYNAGPGSVNRMLALARQACGQPASYRAWRMAGSPAGEWQRWAYSSQFLPKVTAEHAQETIRYVRRVLEAEKEERRREQHGNPGALGGRSA